MKAGLNLGIQENCFQAFFSSFSSKQGRINGNPVADDWAGAVMQKPPAILAIFRTDGPTDRHGEVLSRVSAT